MLVMTPMLQIRWLIKRDTDAIVDLELAWQHLNHYEIPALDEPRLRQHLRAPDKIGMVAELTYHDGEAVRNCVAGYMIYRLSPRSLELVRLAVRPDMRRCGVGLMLMRKLADKLSPERRVMLQWNVDERLDSIHCWLAHIGLRCTCTIVSVDEPAYDSYHFELHHNQSPYSDWLNPAKPYQVDLDKLAAAAIESAQVDRSFALAATPTSSTPSSSTPTSSTPSSPSSQRGGT